jgi:hypothetical protein
MYLLQHCIIEVKRILFVSNAYLAIGVMWKNAPEDIKKNKLKTKKIEFTF